jgi:acetyl-CoA carboxylase carboxyl transferase subunit beta
MPFRLPFRPRPESRADLWTSCPSCTELIYNKQLERNLRRCPHCDHHFRLRVDARLGSLLDPDTFEERDAGLESLDPLGFVDLKTYPDKIREQRAKTGIRDAAVWGFGRIGGHEVAISAMDFAFMGGSMGSVVGEKVTRAAEAALERRLPFIAISTSGGARMQEGTLALMQLVKTYAAIERLGNAGVPYISVMSDPTTGGVFASFAALGDVNLAEPNALIGFAGARVAAGTTGDELPEGFQSAEFLFRHGFVDEVVPRAELRSRLTLLLRYVQPRPDRLAAITASGNGRSADRHGTAGADPEAVRG